MADKLQKLAQAALPPENEELELLAKAQELIDSYHSMNLPPQSMSVFMPFGHALDELKRIRQQHIEGGDDSEMYQRFESFLSHYGKVLNYLAEQGHDVSEDLNMVKHYADLYFQGAPGATSRASAARRILALASKLHEKGHKDLSKQLLKAITAAQPWEEQYRSLLDSEDYDGAREIYLGLDPVDRQEAEEIGRVYASAHTLLSLYVIGKALFEKKKFTEAQKVDNMIRAQFVELPEEMQHQVILVLLPDDIKDQLPQAFRATENAEENTKKMEERMVDMKDRLMPEDACHQCAKIDVPRLLRLADRLDEKGMMRAATKIDNLLKRIAGGTEDLIDLAEDLPITPTEPVKEKVQQGNCPQCGVEVYYRGQNPTLCPHCKKMSPYENLRKKWYGASSALKEIFSKDKVKDKKDEDGVPAKVKEIADAIRRDNKDISDEAAYRMAWETYCSYTNKSYPQCTEKGKSKRKSPKPYEKSSSVIASHKCSNCGGEVGDFEHSDLCEMCHKEGDDGFEKEAGDEWIPPTPPAGRQYRSRQEKEEAEKGERQPSQQFPHAQQYPTKPRYQQTEEEKEELKRRKFDKELEEARKRRSKKADKYVSEEGHFKGREGSGERWDNCIKSQMADGKSRESAEKICGYIKSRKGSNKTRKKVAQVTSPQDIMSLVAGMEGTNLDSIDEILGKFMVPDEIAAKIKTDMLDHLEQKFIGSYEQGAEQGFNDPLTPNNWEQYFEGFMEDEYDTIKGSVFEKALRERLTKRFGVAQERLPEAERGDLPSAEELDYIWSKPFPKEQALKLVKLLMKEGHIQEAKVLLRGIK